MKFAQFIRRAQRIVCGHEGPEANVILADVVTHGMFQQKENKWAFQQKRLTAYHAVNDFQKLINNS